MSLLSCVIPVPAILAGLGLRGAVAGRLITTPDAVVDVDIALPGRDEPPGVTSPDLDPNNVQLNKLSKKSI